ncbi:hypothetical protein GAMM_60304 [Gammaproteobacteria bacterium]
MISKSEVFSSWQRGQFSMQLGGQISMQIDMLGFIAVAVAAVGGDAWWMMAMH